jgi:hypothetical protein
MSYRWKAKYITPFLAWLKSLVEQTRTINCKFLREIRVQGLYYWIVISLILIEIILHPMGDSSYRLNFDQGKKNEIQHHS